MFSEQQEKWLKRVEEMFLRYGIKSVTMDEVARELGISKKTLYAFVESKDDLVYKVMQRHIEAEKAMCAGLFQQAANAIEEMVIVIEANMQQMAQIKSNVVFDLQKYHRDAWEMMEGYQRGSLYEAVRSNLERGVSEGLYRSDFDVDIVARLHVAMSFQLFNEDIFPHPPYKREVVFFQYQMHYLHGIVTDQGRALLLEKFAHHA
ncbi:MAG TPA: TetR/AcrR family transcriptional regulator [Saprospiraceae bacterium]|nr:TetR/AcrR family transcriptional regulator [Saprospiraceae bacterium]